jgi:sugar phosphate isomerase/epimerase
MKSRIHRRNFLKKAGALGAGIGLGALGGAALLADEVASGAPNAEKLGWHLGCQTWTFREFSLFEAIDKTASLGLHYVETGAGMKSLSKEHPELKFTEDSPASIRTAVKKKLADTGMLMKSYGVSPLSKDVGQCRKMFDFAKDMGMETIVSEPDEDAFDTIEKFCDEYGINVAIHNHPQPSRYWNPDTVLRVCKGRSKRIGACCDTGHWLRSGLNPIECLKKLEGRIINFHFKDLNKPGPDARDVPWGTGVSDVKGMLTEVRRQGVKAIFLIEYEYLSPTLFQEVAGCVKEFDKVAAELAGTA